MPILNRATPTFTPQKKLEVKWEGWDGGWNDFFNSTEIKPNELTVADNVMLKGKGTVTGRWGSDLYFLAGTGRTRFLGDYRVPETSVNELLASTDEGYLVKRSGASYTTITGASWASGYDVSGTQLGGKVYLVSKSREMVRYSGATLQSYATIAKPTAVTATNLSGVSGLYTYGWRITAVTDVGETAGSDSVILANLPQDLSNTTVKVSWTPPSTASGAIKSYTVYRGSAGDERYLSQVDALTTTFFDNGTTPSETVFPPVADTTGGPKAGHVLSLDDRLVVSDFANDPSLVQISARYPYESRFNWAYGGGYIRVAPNDGDRVVCTSFVGSNTKGGNVPSTVLVFKERRTFAMVLKTVSIGNYIILDPQYQELLPVGTKSPDSVVRVENDVFFLSLDGLYSVGSEANYLNEIRSKEISTRIRSFMDNLSDSDFSEATASYMDHKYFLSFPTRKQTIVYDYERRSFLGRWITPYGITKWFRYYDSTGHEKRLAGADDGDVKYFDSALNADESMAIAKKILTRREPFNDWTVMKIVELFYVLFRNVKGTVQVSIIGEDRSGTMTSLKSFTITGAVAGLAGYGQDQYGSVQYGLSQDAVSVSAEDFVKWGQLYKTVRVVQLEVISTGASDNWELISSKLTAQPLGVGSLSPTTRV